MKNLVMIISILMVVSGCGGNGIVTPSPPPQTEYSCCFDIKIQNTHDDPINPWKIMHLNFVYINTLDTALIERKKANVIKKIHSGGLTSIQAVAMDTGGYVIIRNALRRDLNTIDEQTAFIKSSKLFNSEPEDVVTDTIYAGVLNVIEILK